MPSNNGRVLHDGTVWNHQTKKWWGTEGLGMNVWEAALQRIHRAWDEYDVVEVMFSGGKDSMVILEAAYQVCKERDAWPLKVIFYDDEVISYETEDYVRRTYRREGIDMDWLCVPVKQRNACTSEGKLEWFPWAPEDRDLWVRDLPPEAITLENITDWYTDPTPANARPTFIEFTNYRAVKQNPGMKVASLMGIRAGESMIRRGVVANERADNYVIHVAPSLDKVYAVYDWSTKDLWTAARDFGWDYNITYDLLEMRGTPPDKQRIGTPFGDEPLERLPEWAECFPDIWEKTCRRVPGAATAGRYSITDLYGYGGLPEKPDDVSWPDFIREHVERHADTEHKVRTAKKIKQLIAAHYRKTKDPILVEAHPITGCSWSLLLMIAIRGDTKNRKSAFSRQGNPDSYGKALATHRKDPSRVPTAMRAEPRPTSNPVPTPVATG